MNIKLIVYEGKDQITRIPKNLNAFIAIGWLNRTEINKLYRICRKGVFIGTSPDEKLFDSVRPNMDSFVTQIVDYFIEKGHRDIGFIGGTDRNIDTGLPSMDLREWSFRQSAAYYQCLNEDHILIADRYTLALNALKALRDAPISMGRGETPVELCQQPSVLLFNITMFL